VTRLALLALFAWFSLDPVTDPAVVVTQCRAYRIDSVPDYTPTPCRVLMGEPEWWARVGAREWDVAPGRAVAVCIENVGADGATSECGDLVEYLEDIP
jgi:hypothetical protein